MADKKIAIMTWLYNGNYGTLLQAYALHTFVKNAGYEVENINYRSSLKTKLKNWLVNRNSPALFVGKFKEKFSKKDSVANEKRNENFSDFLKSNVKLTELASSPEELVKFGNSFDAFICGSDQIWSPYLMNPPYFLSFVPDNKPKIAYAPSFGVTSTSAKKEKMICDFVKRLDFVSVREKQGSDFLKRITGKDYTVMVDPTMLLERKDWEKCIGERIEKEKYIFCYMLTYNAKYVNAVKEYADKNKLKVILIKNDTGFENTDFTVVEDAGPQQWLNYIKYAENVFTDSFHGAIFSVIFHKELVLFKRFSDKSGTSQNSRIYTLTEMLDIKDRIADESSLEKIGNMKTIDFEKTDCIMQTNAKKSGDWLLNALEKACSK